MGVRPKAKALLFARPAALFLLVWSFLVPKNPGAAAFLASLRISKRQFGNALPRHHSIAAATAAAATPHNHSTLLSTSNSPSSVTAVTTRDVVKRSGSEATSLIFLNRGDVSGSPEDRERQQQQKQRNRLLHVAIVPDGNGRWAQSRGMPRELGHAAGAERFKEVIDACREAGCRAVTLFAFSTENWGRESTEVTAILRVIEEKLRSERDAFLRDRVRVLPIGQLHRLPPSLRALLDDIAESQARFEQRDRTARRLKKKANHEFGNIIEDDDRDDDDDDDDDESAWAMSFILALSYGGRAEIADAARRVAEQVKAGRLNPEDITEQILEEAMWVQRLAAATTGGTISSSTAASSEGLSATREDDGEDEDEARMLRVEAAAHAARQRIGDPDLYVRTGGEQRVSNFLLWQLAYTELVVSPHYWPDFGAAELREAFEEFDARSRRYGKEGSGEGSA